MGSYPFSLRSIWVLLLSVFNCDAFYTPTFLRKSRLEHFAPDESQTIDARTVFNQLQLFPISNAVNNEQSSELTNNEGGNECFEIRGLYPAIAASSNGTIQLDSIHQLYFEEYRTSSYPSGKVALSLHGGPGAGSFPNHARFFNPDLYGRIILYDQRGCGKSKPSNTSQTPTEDNANFIIQNNTLEHLVHDIETLRLHLDIEQWDVILGGSWGSTLALAYAQTYPNVIKAIVLRGVCLFRNEEIDWLFSNQGMSKLNPSGWKSLEESIQSVVSDYDELESNKSHRQTLHLLYHSLLGTDPVVRFVAAKAWFQWEMSASSFHKRQLSSSPNTTNVTATINDINHVILEWIPAHRTWVKVEKTRNTSTTTTIEPTMDELSNLRLWQCPNDFEKVETIDIGNMNSITDELSMKPIITMNCKENITAALNLTQDQINFANSFVPSQAMLTCFYSVNNENMCNKFSFLSPSTIRRINDIPCIAVQGGKDHICPPDTALDLNKVWPNMQLRIPLQAGHSMYDPAITHELVEATDFFGKE